LCRNYSEEELAQVCSRISPTSESQPILGKYKKIGFAKGRVKGSYSGSVTAILLAAKQADLIDGALGVAKGDTIFKAKPKYASTLSEIGELSGMRHTVSSHLSILKEVPYSDKIALVGLPCHVEAIRHAQKKQLLTRNVEYLLGIACGTNYLYPEFLKVVQAHGINVQKITDYTLRDSDHFMPYFSFIVDGEKEFKVPVSKTLKCIPRGCYNCNEYLGNDSDLSFGVLGAPKGQSLVFIRTEKGEKLLNNAIELGYLDFKPINEKTFKVAQTLWRAVPTKLYLSMAFRTGNPVGAELMAKFKVHYLNKKLKTKQ
jgi:coenzyme F420 hydrogenase subunit beta